ncbi:MAG: ParB/RepB/Spo0J family partition protein [Lachnospiraceae bacterium]|nr:ParB/RepB/Spo0J family partition protein [Lachnospiraceae bacterium]
MPKKGLGSKGLGMEALINTQINELKDVPGNTIEVDINKIEPNSGQPRRRFEEEKLTELAASIKEYGIIQPIIVRKENDYYKIIAGERRWRAAKIAGINKIPIIIKDINEKEAFELALIENLQRADLNPIEEAEGYRRLINEYGFTQEALAQKIGKNRTTITNALRLFNLDPRVMNFVIENKISSGHSRALLALPATVQFELAEKIIEEDLSVRAVEAIVKRELENTKIVDKNKPKPTYLSSIEKELMSILGTKVSIINGRKKGKIEIEYYSDKDLERILELVKKP